MVKRKALGMTQSALGECRQPVRKGARADLVQPAATIRVETRKGPSAKTEADLELLRLLFAVIRELESLDVQQPRHLPRSAVAPNLLWLLALNPMASLIECYRSSIFGTAHTEVQPAIIATAIPWSWSSRVSAVLRKPKGLSPIRSDVSCYRY
jgi:hypothetical protein